MTIKEFATVAGIKPAEARKVAEHIGGTRTGKKIAGKPSIELPDNAVELYQAYKLKKSEPPKKLDDKATPPPEEKPEQKKNIDNWEEPISDILSRYGLDDDLPEPEATPEPEAEKQDYSDGYALIITGVLETFKVADTPLRTLWSDTVGELLSGLGINSIYAKIAIVVIGGAILFIPTNKERKIAQIGSSGSKRSRKDKPTQEDNNNVEWGYSRSSI